MTVAMAINLARAETGMSPTMSAIDEKLARIAVARVLADFYREFEPTPQRMTVTFEDRVAAIPKGIEITALYHAGSDISPHRCRSEDLPTQ